MKNNHTERTIPKLLFTSANVYSELSNQGITSFKGESGAYILYKNIHLAYYNGERKVLQKIFNELCFDLKQIGSKRIFIGEFILKRELNLKFLITDKYSIELNRAIINVM